MGALDGLRVGAVSYLNTKPLIAGMGGNLTLDVPAQLAAKFFAGRLDVALLPVFELLRAGGGRAADNVAIACRGEVFSVVVAAHGPLGETATIVTDPSSRSSAALLRVVLAEWHPTCRVVDAGPDDAARLIIGDPAIRFRRSHPAGWTFHDLGRIWMERTGLPFVFAVWAIAPHVANAPAVAAELRTLKQNGLAAVETLVAHEDDPDFAREYLSRWVTFDVGPDEKRSLELFASLSGKHGFLDGHPRVEWV